MYRPSLARRLTRLEKKLNIRNRHTCAGYLRKAEERTIEGLRIRDRGLSLHSDIMGRPLTPEQTVAEEHMKWTPRSLGEGSGKVNVAEKVGVFLQVCMLSEVELTVSNAEGAVDRQVGMERTRKRGGFG